jgi:hypothetical protein
MVMFMFKKKWKTLYHILSADLEDINAFHTVKKDFKTVYIRMYKCFLLYYKRKCRENGGSLLKEMSCTLQSLNSSHLLVLVNLLMIRKLVWKHMFQNKLSPCCKTSCRHIQ